MNYAELRTKGVRQWPRAARIGSRISRAAAGMLVPGLKIAGVGVQRLRAVQHRAHRFEGGANHVIARLLLGKVTPEIWRCTFDRSYRAVHAIETDDAYARRDGNALGAAPDRILDLAARAFRSSIPLSHPPASHRRAGGRSALRFGAGPSYIEDMKHIMALACLALASGSAATAQTEVQTAAPVDRWREDPGVILDSADISLDDFRWVARPLVVFADDPAVPAFQEQIGLLMDRIDDLAARDVVVITDTDPEAMSEVRRELRPRGFMLALIGKDGTVALRKPFPRDVREITRTIDKMPLRRQELRESRDADR